MKKIFTFLAMLLMVSAVSAQQLYFCGDKPIGNGWGPTDANQVALTLASDGYTNTASIDVTGSPYFCVSIGGGTDWNDFNGNKRYSVADANWNAAQSGTYQLEKLGDHANSFSPGHYDISIDARTMMMTMTYTPAAAPTETTYSVVGDTGLGLAWDPSDASLVMTKKSDNVYELKRENVTLETGKDYYWRVLVNATTYGWGADQYGANGKNAGGDDNVISNFDTGVYNLTFTLDLSAGDASIPTVTAVKAGEATTYNLFVLDQTGWSSLKVYSWNNSGNQIFGVWGATTVTGNETVTINGNTYYKVTYLPAADATANLIFFNGVDDMGDNDPTRALITVNADKDIYVKVTPGEAEEITDPSSYSGISSVTLEQRADGLRYNLSGQQVNADYKGIVITNGKKVVVK